MHNNNYNNNVDLLKYLMYTAERVSWIIIIKYYYYYYYIHYIHCTYMI